MRQVLKGSLNVSVDVYIIDSTDGTPELGVLFNTAGMDLEYRRESSAVVDVTEATLAALTTAHADGGFLEIGHGYYRFDLPDAAFATGASTVSIQGTVTGMIILPQTIQLVDFDPEDGVRLGLTALPNFAADGAGGLPVSDLGGLDLDTKLANTNEITVVRMAALTDWINGGRLDLILDIIAVDVAGIDGASMRGTDNVPVASVTGTSDSGGTNTMVDSDRTEADTHWVGSYIRFGSGGSANNVGVTRMIDTFTASSDTIRFNPVVLTAITTETYEILPASNIDEILIDTAELQQDWTNAGRLDAILDIIAADVVNIDGQSMRGTNSALLAADINLTGGVVDTVTTTVNLTTNNDKTGYALSTAGVNAVADAILPETNNTLSDIPFLFVAASDGRTPVTGATTITITRSLDGAAFGAVSGTTVTEIGNGMYHIDASAADMNAGKIIFRVAATGGTPGAPDDVFVAVVTRSGV